MGIRGYFHRLIDSKPDDPYDTIFAEQHGEFDPILALDLVINKICFNEDYTEIQITDNANTVTPYISESIKFKDKFGYIFEVKNGQVQVIKDDKFIYPKLKLLQNCYEILNIKRQKVDFEIQTVCIPDNGAITISNENKKLYGK